MKPARFITDTTLLYFGRRMQPKERVELAGRLDEIGVYEVVTRLASRKELDACGQALHSAKQAVYVRMDAAQLSKALKTGVRAVHLEVPASYPMIYTVYKKNKDWAKKTLLTCRDMLMKADVETSLILSDASRAEPCFLESMVQLAVGIKVEKLVAKDLMGIQTLSACADLIGTMLAFGYTVGYEGSDQFGLSVANTIQALRIGALQRLLLFGRLGQRMRFAQIAANNQPRVPVRDGPEQG